jgi:hypothetical protein
MLRCGPGFLKRCGRSSGRPGWVEVPLTTPFPVAASTEYIVSYTCNTHYVGTPGVFAEPVKRDGIMAIAGLYRMSDLGENVPDKTHNNLNYFLDISYAQTPAP